MTHDRWNTSDPELTAALRAHYAAPEGEAYWDSLEARILAHVARGGDAQAWWTEIAALARPGLVAAAALILAASAALVQSRQREVASAYASVISPAPASMEASIRGASIGDGDAAIHLLTSK